MFRHFKNLNELVVVASCSCGLSFLGRLIPELAFPVFLIRLGFLVYFVYVIGICEGDRGTATLLAVACILGAIGGSWDYWFIWMKYNGDVIRLWSLVITLIILLPIAVYLIKEKENAKPSKK